MLQSSIQRHADIIYYFEGCKCHRKHNKNVQCNIKVIKQYNIKDDPDSGEKQQIIYGATTNYLVPSYKWYCNAAPSKKYSLLLSNYLLQFTNNNYIKIVTDADKEINQDLFRIKNHFITADILFTINDLTLNDVNAKSVSKWRSKLISNFVATAQKVLRCRQLKYNARKLRSVVKKHVLELKFLNFIRNWLWRENWAPFVGMLIYLIVCI